ncbi:uncharacterized protein LOC128996269 isoform X2 [Macrosteles quadrilineatus]|uniref:uncharacterized protein LOC128996269 isoform X2 n=1 Tax=Macrosteles quadrilineatus TaxID=74068 RepID=UPI0023E20645|nr:uncharacterized protein LOC128996269 isoform X2 [Macrosteles quadrilineatus]
MPNISGASLNGNAGNSSLFNSLDDDEESFVVLERSTANDVSLLAEVAPRIQPTTPQNGPSCSFPAFMSTSTSTYLSTGMNTSAISNQVQIDPMAMPFDTTHISVSVEEIDKRLQEVLHENINLKENLYQTNLAMKQQLSTVRLLQDKALETQKQHQAKFEETKALILKLGSEKSELQEKYIKLSEELNKVKEENKELSEKNVQLSGEATRLMGRNGNLMKLSSMQEDMIISAERKMSLQATNKETELREVVDQLTRKLEAVERARRQQEFDIDKLQAQLARSTQDLTETQRRLAHTEQALETAQAIPVKSENSLHYGEKLTKYEGLLKQFKSSIQEEHSRFNSLNSWLTMTDPTGNSAQFEITELRHLLAEEQAQSVSRKEKLYQTVATIHEMLGDFQQLGEELERVRADHAVKESHGLAYDELQKKGFREQIDSLTAKLVEREEALAISERHLSSLQEAVRLQNDEKKEGAEIATLKEQVNNLVGQVTAKDEELKAKTDEMEALKTDMQKLRVDCDTIPVLEEQAKIYQADFEAERKSRETLVAEKERLVEDLRHLQRRNHELIDELNNSRGETPAQPSAPAVQTREPERETPSPVDNSENEELEINMVFHEKQDGNLCAQHCLNALLQKSHFNAVDLAELAMEMDYAEKQTLVEAGINTKEFQSFISQPSQNMDDSGFFSVQVIGCALALWGLEMVPFSSNDPRAIAARQNLNTVRAFICHSHAHWFTIRRVGSRWYNLNSTLDGPQPLSDLYLSLFLLEFEKEGNFVFMVFGDLPACAGDEGVTEVSEIPCVAKEEPKEAQNSLHLVLREKPQPPTSFTERLRLLLLNKEACGFFGL